MKQKPESKDREILFKDLWDYNDPGATEKNFRAILEETNASEDKSAYLQLLTQLARSLGLQMKFDEAHKILDEVENRLSDELYVARIRYLLERGRVLNSSKQKDRGKKFFLEAFELAKFSNEDFYAVDAAHMLGIVEQGDGSLNWNEKAMRTAEASDDKNANGWLGSLYNNTGWAYHDMGKFEKAFELFRKNVEWHTMKNSVQELIIAKWCVGRTMRSLNLIEDALKLQQNLLEEAKIKGIVDGYIFEEIAECNLILGNKGEASENFAKAYEELSKDIWLAEYEKERLDRMKKLGGE